MFELAYEMDKFSVYSRLDEAILSDKEFAFASFLHLASINVFMKDTFRGRILKNNNNAKYQRIVLSKGAKKIPYLCTQLQVQTLIELYQGVDIKQLDISDCTCIPEASLDLLFRSFGKTLEEVILTGLTIKPSTSESIATNCKAIKVLNMNLTNLSEEGTSSHESFI